MDYLLKLRETYRKHKLAWSLLLGLEACFVSYSVGKGVKQHRLPHEVLYDVHSSVARNSHVPLIAPLVFNFESIHERNFFNDKNQVAPEEVAMAFYHPKTIKRLEQLIEDDKKNIFSETSLYITLGCGWDNKPFLNLYKMSNTLNERNAKVLYKHRNNPWFVVDFIKNNKEEYQAMTGLSDYIFERLESTLNGMNDPTKRENFGKFLAGWYVDSSDSCSHVDYLTWVDFYLKNFLLVKGKYVGMGHIHCMEGDTGPSDQDLENSKKVRELLFVNKHDGIIMYDLVKSKQHVTFAKSLKGGGAK